jgi:hypothetical protein
MRPATVEIVAITAAIVAASVGWTPIRSEAIMVCGKGARNSDDDANDGGLEALRHHQSDDAGARRAKGQANTDLTMTGRHHVDKFEAAAIAPANRPPTSRRSTTKALACDRSRPAGDP